MCQRRADLILMFLRCLKRVSVARMVCRSRKQTELSKTGGRYAARANYNHNLWYGNSALPLVYSGLNIAAVFCAARKSDG